MQLAFKKIKQKLRSFNILAHSWEDFEHICKIEKIKIQICDYPDDIKGYYCIEEKKKGFIKHFIVINSKLNAFERLFTGLHELIHFYLHVPLNPRQYFFRTTKLVNKKHEVEAENGALILMIPKKLLIELSHTPEDELNPFTQEVLVKRDKVYKDFGI